MLNLLVRNLGSPLGIRGFGVTPREGVVLGIVRIRIIRAGHRREPGTSTSMERWDLHDRCPTVNIPAGEPVEVAHACDDIALHSNQV